MTCDVWREAHDVRRDVRCVRALSDEFKPALQRAAAAVSAAKDLQAALKVASEGDGGSLGAGTSEAVALSDALKSASDVMQLKQP